MKPSRRSAVTYGLQKVTYLLRVLHRPTKVGSTPGVAETMTRGGDTGKRATAFLSAALLVLAACSGGNGDSVTSPTAEPTLESTTTTPTSTTVAPTTEPTTTATPTTEPAQPAEDEFRAVWEEAWRIAADPDSTEADFADVASPDVAARLDAVVTGDAERTFTHYASVSEPGADGFVEIHDCLLSQPPFAGGAATWFSGRAGPDADGTIRIVALTPESLTGCVPAETAEAAIADYERYWDAVPEYWVPADPTSPLLAETMTGEHLELIAGLVADDAANGRELRGRPETHPEIFEFRSPTELVITDCQLTDPERGVYVTATGERTDLIAPIVDGQRDARSAVMVLEDGTWKVSDRQGQVNFDCDFAPTPLGVPIVGEGGAQ